MMGFTHTGEPGFCLYIPSEYALHVYDRLITAGFDYGIRDVGSLTQRFMRIEKFIPFWAEDLTRDTTPFEAGCNHVVKLDMTWILIKICGHGEWNLFIEMENLWEMSHLQVMVLLWES
jgi:pyruvate dehydrogenase phosphatase regulatory subunit